MAWIDYRKAHDMVHGFCARMVGVPQNLFTLIENSMKNWKNVNIKPGDTWKSRHQKGNVSRRLIVAITVCDNYDSTVTDSKVHKSWLPTQERRMQDQSPAIYG